MSTTLHTFNKSSSANSSFNLCLASMGKQDALLLLEDAVCLLLEPTAAKLLTGMNADENKPQMRVFALAPDLAVRGISAKIPPAVRVVDYREFVALCLEYDRVVNWV